MKIQTPLVSIGLAVYNGENYIREAIDSILAQTFEDFELIISDNASTDRTQAICLEYAAKDSRIQYHRNSYNRGCAWNQSRVIELAQGKYFKLAAHDDLIAPTFLEKCVEVLEKNPNIVLVHPWTRSINEIGEMIADERDGNRSSLAPPLNNPLRRLLIPILGDGTMYIDSAQPWIRFRSMVLTAHQCYHIFGLIRTSILKQTPLFGSYSHADGILLARLALLGSFYDFPEHLFMIRKHPQQSSAVFSKDGFWDYKGFTTVFWDPSKQGKLTFPYWRQVGEYCKAIFSSPVSLYDKGWCLFCVIRFASRWRKYLVQELLSGGFQLLGFGKRQTSQTPVAGSDPQLNTD